MADDLDTTLKKSFGKGNCYKPIKLLPQIMISDFLVRAWKLLVLEGSNPFENQFIVDP